MTWDFNLKSHRLLGEGACTLFLSHVVCQFYGFPYSLSTIYYSYYFFPLEFELKNDIIDTDINTQLVTKNYRHKNRHSGIKIDTARHN